MTREGLIKHWDVICAFKEGKTVQFRDDLECDWVNTGKPHFHANVEYRIKPEPREWWVNVYPKDCKFSVPKLHGSYEAARAKRTAEAVNTIRVREVIE